MTDGIFWILDTCNCQVQVQIFAKCQLGQNVTTRCLAELTLSLGNGFARGGEASIWCINSNSARPNPALKHGNFKAYSSCGDLKSPGPH